MISLIKSTEIKADSICDIIDEIDNTPDLFERAEAIATRLNKATRDVIEGIASHISYTDTDYVSPGLFQVLDGIIDSSYGYTDETLNDPQCIKNYAEACGLRITDAQAEKIQRVGLKWRNQQIEGGGNWVHYRYEAEEALEE